MTFPARIIPPISPLHQLSTFIVAVALAATFFNGCDYQPPPKFALGKEDVAVAIDVIRCTCFGACNGSCKAVCAFEATKEQDVTCSECVAIQCVPPAVAAEFVAHPSASQP